MITLFTAITILAAIGCIAYSATEVNIQAEAEITYALGVETNTTSLDFGQVQKGHTASAGLEVWNSEDDILQDYWLECPESPDSPGYHYWWSALVSGIRLAATAGVNDFSVDAVWDAEGTPSTTGLAMGNQQIGDPSSIITSGSPVVVRFDFTAPTSVPEYATYDNYGYEDLSWVLSVTMS